MEDNQWAMSEERKGEDLKSDEDVLDDFQLQLNRTKSKSVSIKPSARVHLPPMQLFGKALPTALAKKKSPSK